MLKLKVVFVFVIMAVAFAAIESKSKLGETCSNSNDCESGLVCTSVGATSECFEEMKVGAYMPCAGLDDDGKQKRTPPANNVFS